MKTKRPDELNFLSKQTPETLKAISALRDVFDRGGVDVAERTFAGAVSERLLQEWKRSSKLTENRGRPCVQKVRGKRCSVSQGHCECTPPGTDHATLWSKDGKAKYYVSQPYGLDMDTIEEINKFCRANELQYHITSRGAFYFPSKAIMVVYQRASG